MPERTGVEKMSFAARNTKEEDPTQGGPVHRLQD